MGETHWPPKTADGAFATTQWSVILKAAREGEEQSTRVLNHLCQCYWSPIYAFIRRRGFDVDAALDYTQAFFAAMFENKAFTGADPEKGKFRTYLLGAVKFFLSNEQAKEQAIKRGGGSIHVSMDVVEMEAWLETALFTEETPETLFEKQWGHTVLRLVKESVREDYARRGKADHFTMLEPFLLGGGDETYASLAETHGISVSAVKMAVLRLRQRFGERLREHIAATVESEAQVEEEIRNLMAAF